MRIDTDNTVSCPSLVISFPADAEEGGTDKFAVSDEEEKDSILSQEQSSEIQLKLEELIEPKLLTCSPTDKNT